MSTTDLDSQRALFSRYHGLLDTDNLLTAQRAETARLFLRLAQRKAIILSTPHASGIHLCLCARRARPRLGYRGWREGLGGEGPEIEGHPRGGARGDIAVLQGEERRRILAPALRSFARVRLVEREGMGYHSGGAAGLVFRGAGVITHI
ncbi:unnamed protein product [Zymoseptoria tritici ST99CH_1A5]|uniref:Uncharacterized protein n=2 Tax=Zymoseptoria tritici TaxID=1047171 RepID=A0A2H1H9Y5_ZYMTR|nr:unnamed protein product [Zymoseptoria tritici ST99CH_1E4]SMR65113.1 unnamed protein product [Zymoseptoria tritici ST99CH_3D1]SMY30516.1 unnamed protein product [Zymoseptoria tritici ST99CH_1A5]